MNESYDPFVTDILLKLMCDHTDKATYIFISLYAPVRDLKWIPMTFKLVRFRIMFKQEKKEK